MVIFPLGPDHAFSHDIG